MLPVIEQFGSPGKRRWSCKLHQEARLILSTVSGVATALRRPLLFSEMAKQIWLELKQNKNINKNQPRAGNWHVKFQPKQLQFGIVMCNHKQGFTGVSVTSPACDSPGSTLLVLLVTCSTTLVLGQVS
ncbi:hypothetical protein KIL84_017924 [Mauremys mutica]|uniref:Uncharacterized protein n=1 Tax=Mauremys mutica TaxID=74926 RepID=A0A9D4B983_9SAUR|nr:hypothetical protein KIL84_017924 [Mauremys mutica]